MVLQYTTLKKVAALASLLHCCCCCCHPIYSGRQSCRRAPAGVTQEEGLTGILVHLPSAVLALIFLARRIQSSFSLVDRVSRIFVYPRINRSPLVGHGFHFSFFIFCEEKSQFG